MNIKIIEERDAKKNRLVFEIDAGHTLCNLLKAELYNDNNAKAASYAIEHPLTGKPKFIIETSGEDPRTVLIEAANRLKRHYEKLEKEFSKELK